MGSRTLIKVVVNKHSGTRVVYGVMDKYLNIGIKCSESCKLQCNHQLPQAMPTENHRSIMVMGAFTQWGVGVTEKISVDRNSR